LKTTVIARSELDFSQAVDYHYGRFPPTELDYRRLVKPLTSAAAALARYDQMLKGMHNGEILLAPLRRQEAVVSSRIEGTVSTLDELLRLEAEQPELGEAVGTGPWRNEALEVFLYARAMKFAQRQMRDGAALSPWLIRSAHRMLLDFGRGADLSPGEFKTTQNYLADRTRRKVRFVPISPEQLPSGIDRLFAFLDDDDWDVLTRTALAHLEFEALHPFKDGNGRIGRMMIPLTLWRHGVLSAPHFYMSQYLEDHKDEYIDRMRQASATGEWTEWVLFFLGGLEEQARRNLAKAEEIRALYEEMKERFRTLLASQWSVAALDFVFARPVFFNRQFTGESGIPLQTAHRVSKALIDGGVLTVLESAAGRRSALLSFDPLIEISRRAG